MEDNRNKGRAAVVYCPVRGGDRKGKRRARVAAALSSAGLDYDMVQSETPDSVGRLVRMMSANGYGTIVVAGGDSALNDAVNEVMSMEKAGREAMAIGILPNGSANDFAAYWGLDYSRPEEAAAAIAAGKVRRVDTGCLRFGRPGEDIQRRYFVNCATAGLPAAVANSYRRAKGIFGRGPVSFVPGMVASALQGTSYKMEVEVNGETLGGRLMALCIGNAPGYGLTPSAVPYSGLLDISVIRHPKAVQTLDGIALFLRGRVLNHRSVTPYRTKKAEVRLSRRTPFNVDGRPFKPQSDCFSAFVEPEALRLIVP